MNTQTASVAGKVKLAFLFSLALLCAVCTPKSSTAQSASTNTAVMPFALPASGSYTYDQILANPMMVCKSNACKVTEFTISFLPKDQDFAGPYRTSGDKMKPEQVDLVQKLKETKNEKTRVFIEDIHVNCNGTEIKSVPVAAFVTLK